MLLYLADLEHDFPGTMRYSPTGIGYLAATVAAKLADRVEIVLFKSPNRFLDAIDARPPDLVGLTNYVWNSALGNFVGEYLTRNYPDIPIVMGGPNIRTDEEGIGSFLREHDFVDRYCMYAGETSMLQIVERLMEQAPHERTGLDLRALPIDGTYALCDGALTGNANYYMPQNLDEIPSPFLGGWLDAFLAEGCIPIFESNRGCPFSCTFCVWGVSALNKVRRFSMERVKSELTYVVESGFKTPMLSFGDANFGILPRDVEIAQHVRHLYDHHQNFSGVQFYWSKTLKPHMIDIGRILGPLTQTYIAFQSLDPLVLANIKRENIGTDELLGLIRKLKGFNDSTRTDILLGLPGETYASHLDSLETALSYGIDLIHGGEIRMLPGAEIEREESRRRFGIKTKYRLIEGEQGRYRGRFVYEMEEVIRETNAMTEREMLELRVLRAIFYASVTLGEHLPVVAYLKSRGLRVTQLCQRVRDLGETDPEFGPHLLWLRTRSEEEWFATPADLERYFADKANQDAVLAGNAFVKLNIGFLARLYLDAQGYDAYYRVFTRAVSDLVPLSDRALAYELVELSKARNYLVKCLRSASDREPQMVVSISPAAARALVDGGFIHSTDPCLQDGRLRLEVNPRWVEVCERFVDGHRHDMSVLRLSQMILTYAGRFMMKANKLDVRNVASSPPSAALSSDPTPRQPAFPIKLSVRN